VYSHMTSHDDDNLEAFLEEPTFQIMVTTFSILHKKIKSRQEHVNTRISLLNICTTSLFNKYDLKAQFSILDFWTEKVVLSKRKEK